MSLDPTRLWYGRSPLTWPLIPLSWLYCGIARLRRAGYRSGWLESRSLPVPVIVVGNLTVGGTGKTPLVLYLVELLKREGLRPGILARGYGGAAEIWPQLVTPGSHPGTVGDEPVLLARRGGVAVVAGPDRIASGLMAIEQCGCDILVSDDGLQHYRLRRDLEILLVDGARGFGNGRCLPAGPLREPRSRAEAVDLVVYKGSGAAGHAMGLAPGVLTHVSGSTTTGSRDLQGRRILAVAGIGHPELFFRQLEQLGLEIERRPYPDHHRYTAADAAGWVGRTVVMTEKDAVKCATFAAEDHWYLPVEARLDDAFAGALLNQLRRLERG